MIRQDYDYTVRLSRANTTASTVYDFFDGALFVNHPTSAGHVPDTESMQLISTMMSKYREDVVPADLRTKVDGVSAATRDEATEQRIADLVYTE